ncbi:hypothetical protein T459_17272 [Capsicum annuum]|uniref:TIR domain-containing protein n=1 Tax=Capsicum annuum TaxID=4072 RepID=A0A2G2ZB33_CAPAN|nr:hypothetical protein T459_17272 [Capsicum annuum]
MDKYGADNNIEFKRAISELTQGRDLAQQLQLHLNATNYNSSASPENTLEFLLHNIQSNFDNALSMLQYNSTTGDNSNSIIANSNSLTIPVFGVSDSPRSSPPHSEDSDRDLESKDPHATRKSEMVPSSWKFPGILLLAPPCIFLRTSHILSQISTTPMASQIQSVRNWKYDVFLNFRPEDLGRIFIAHLYKRLEDLRINAFRPDDVESERGEGEPISTKILEAIEESRIAITIFSKYYASSRRCLQELTKIMECVDNKGMKFFSVLYQSTASQVLCNFDQVLLAQLGIYGLNGSYMVEFLRWKDILCKAFNIAGLNCW